MSTNPSDATEQARAAAGARAVDDSWREWIAENLLRDCGAESMLAAMAGAGLPREESAREIRQVASHPAMAAAMRMRQSHRKLESVVANHQLTWESDPAYQSVERRESISKRELFERHARGGRPLVITGLARDWPALSRWEPAKLKARFGELLVEIQSGRASDPRFEENKLSLRSTVPLGSLIDAMLLGGPSNDAYLTANNELLRRPECASLFDDVGTLPDYLDPSAFRAKSSLWLGPAGTKTPLHHDTVMLFHTQIVGSKLWRMASPLETPRMRNANGVFSPLDLSNIDERANPELRGLKVLEARVDPGETIFLPLGWWHQVEGLSPSVSISYINIDLPNQFSYADPGAPA